LTTYVFCNAAVQDPGAGRPAGRTSTSGRKPGGRDPPGRPTRPGGMWRVIGGRWYRPRVKKTSIYIEPDVDIALARRAAADGTTKANLIRRALRDATEGSVRVKPNARAVFTGPADLASRADEHLEQSGFGER
jgi:hypothetical protein